MDDPIRWADPLIRERTSGRVLDVGCGEGRFLPPRGIGIDTHVERLRVARARSPLVVRADAHAIPFADATFDTVFAHRMLNDAGRIDLVLTEIARVLRPEGRLLIFTRALSDDGDRLDRVNGELRLRPFFDRVEVLGHPLDERAALFVANGPRRPAAH